MSLDIGNSLIGDVLTAKYVNFSILVRHLGFLKIKRSRKKIPSNNFTWRSNFFKSSWKFHFPDSEL